MLLQECRRAYEKLPAEAKYRVRQRCAEDASVRTKPEAFMLAIHSITDRISPQPSPAESEHIPHGSGRHSALLVAVLQM